MTGFFITNKNSSKMDANYVFYSFLKEKTAQFEKSHIFKSVFNYSESIQHCLDFVLIFHYFELHAFSWEFYCLKVV